MSRANPYWEAVSPWVARHQWTHGLAIDSLRNWNAPGFPRREELIKRFCFTVPDPGTVRFVTKWLGPRAVDPMAGSGYWARLLAERGCDIVAYDLHPPRSHRNAWHPEEHFKIQEGNAPQVARKHSDRTLLLAWPPYDDDAGAKTVAAYRGRRIVYIGEGPGGCCGSDEMFAALDHHYDPIHTHMPVQWFGLHDYVTVYDRKSG